MKRTLSLNPILPAVFYGALLLVLFFAPIPETKIKNFKLLENLLNGTDNGFVPLGKEFTDFDGLLPQTGRISFIMDYRFSNYGRTVEQIYTAQSYFAPLVINTSAEEKLAVVYCSSDAVAEKRLAQEGYRWVRQLGSGKGLAEKIL